MRCVEKPADLDCSVHVGVCEAALPAVCSQLIADTQQSCHILVSPDRRRIERWAHDVKFFLDADENANLPFFLWLPPQERSSVAVDEDLFDRLATLDALVATSPQKLLLLTTLDALFQEAPERKSFEANRICVRVGERHNLATFAASLANIGYANESVCEQPGEYALRGGLVDVYPTNASAPCRIDFFGDEIESIRPFDPNDQRTNGAFDELSIAEFTHEGKSSKENSRKPPSTMTLIDYLPQTVHWIFPEAETQAAIHPQFFTVPEKIYSLTPSLESIWKRRLMDKWSCICELDTGDNIFGAATHVWESESLGNYRNFQYAEESGAVRVESERQFRIQFLNTIAEWANTGSHTKFVSANLAEQERLQELLQEDGGTQLPRADFVLGELSEGFVLNNKISGKVVYVTRAEIFGNKRRTPIVRTQRKRVQRAVVDHLLDFKELVDGDPLVHLQHGVCLYRGIHKMDLGGKQRELIRLEFDEGHTVHLPLHESHLLSRYVGFNKLRPKLGKPGSGQWEKTRSAAEMATLDYAAELLAVQAQRKIESGHAFAPDAVWQKEFEAAFPFRETVDQLKAIRDTKADMESPMPMDRLLCGDVGFGKTEVALRAAFKAVMDGHQVALLVPTTILAQQHFNTFRERMADYPIVVEMLSRFRKPAQRTQIIQQLKQGKIDIVIGTHALLSSKVQFRKLGLLVIDEEHRFGVRHKEQIKKMRTHVDILSMSATPIPRTLYLALMGARQLSVIETPPHDRLPIETYVKNYSTELVKTAIEREVARGGQVFYLHNRVQTIESVVKGLQAMLPDVRIAYGHGQMDEEELERIMTEFVEGRHQVLVCTTIIENGLDIPNCNTILIEGADRFGLSQLYQLRGRVGRFKRQAYAYLLLHRHGNLVEQARKRLSSLRQHNQLGAGFRIAMRDLELRGSGHVLGVKQSGFIAGVGFDLYCQLLRQSIARLKGDPSAARIRAQLRLDCVRLGESLVTAQNDEGFGYKVLKNEELEASMVAPIEANIPLKYIAEAQLRIDFYRQLALAENWATVQEIRASLKDRFGKWPTSVEAMLRCSEIRVLAEEKGFALIETEGNRLMCHYADKKRGAFFKTGSRFPRLTSSKALYRLDEIIKFLQRLTN